MVKVFLEDGTRCLLHRSFACYYSPVLKEAFKRDLPEDRSHVHIVEHTDKETSALFAEWLYKQHLEVDADGSNGVTTKSLVRLWVLAGMLAVPPLQNKVIDLLHDIYKRDATISTVCLRYVYDNTKKGSALRRFFIHQCANGLEPEVLQLEPQHFPQAMLLELAITTRALLKTTYNVPADDPAQFYVEEFDD